MRHVVPLLLLAAIVSGGRPSQACIRPLSIESVSPAAGSTEVPLDSALVVTYEREPVLPVLNRSLDEGPWLDWQIVVREANGGAPVQGQSVAWNRYAWQEDTLLRKVWRPDAPYAPGTKYVVEVSVVNPNFESDEPVSWTSEFTTGESLLPPVTSSGALRVEVAAAERCQFLCMQPNECGRGEGCDRLCNPVVLASVTLPTVSGGQSGFGYDAVVHLGSDPFEAWRDVIGRAGDELQVELPDRGEPYTPCFTATISDPAGLGIETEVLCLDAVDPEKMLQDDPAEDASPDAAPDASAEPSLATTDTGSSNGGCSTTTAPTSSTSVWSLFLVGMLLGFASVRSARHA